MDNAIHGINHYSVDSVVCFVITYPRFIGWIADLVISPVDSRRYPAFQQLAWCVSSQAALSTSENFGIVACVDSHSGDLSLNICFLRRVEGSIYCCKIVSALSERIIASANLAGTSDPRESREKKRGPNHTK